MFGPVHNFMQAQADKTSMQIGNQLRANADKVAANRALRSAHMRDMAQLQNQKDMMGMQQAHEKDMLGRKTGILHGLLKRI